MNENVTTEFSLPLPDNGRKVQVGDISFVYKNTYHPIYWVGDEPYRPRVETLVIKNGKDIFLRMYDTCEEGSLYRYRLPGGSLDNDSTKEQQAENETNEEALLSISEIHNTGLSYYHYYEEGKLLKGGDICIKYRGTISDIFIAKYKGKVDKSTIEKHDLDDDMATNGKFYPIIKVCQLLRPEHVEAIMNSGLVDDNVKGSVRLILRGDKKTKIPEAPVSENLETYLTRPKYIGKNILLYHGSPMKIDRIDPISCNNGTRISGFRMSSFWSDNIGVSIAFSLAQILNGTQVLARFGIDESGNAGLMVVGSDRQTVKSLLHDKVIYIHKKSMPSKMVGRGHARGLQEFTLDISVVPDDIDVLTYDDYCDYIHYITTDQYEKQKILGEKKNSYVPNSKDNIMEKILYYKKDELKKKVKEFKSYTEKSNNIVTEGSVKLPMMLYHGGRDLYDELRPTGIDFGNAFQKMGWSLFCWTKYSSAIGWGVFSVLKHLKSLDTNITIEGCKNSQTPIIDERVYNYLKENVNKIPESDRIFYVYSVKPKSDYKLGLGHSSNTPNCITVRKDHIKPDKIDKFVLDMKYIDDYCMVVPIGYKVTAKDMGLNGRASSFLMTKDYMYNHKARKPLTNAHNSGELVVGDDIEKYAKDHDIPINRVKISKRVHDILHESTNLSLWGNPVPKNVTLYHASPTQGIKYIEPRQTAAYKDLGPVVFSSRYKSFAACFGTYWNDTTMKQGTDPDDLEKASMWIIDKAYDWSKPCSMYILENDGSFRELVGHPHEYISPNKIKVKKEIKFNSYYAMVKAYDIEVFDYATKQKLTVTESAVTEAKSVGANTTGMKRSELPDEMFGIPSQRKYELDTEKHVRSAIKLFNWVDPKYEKELATNIIKRMKYFNITDVNVGPTNRFGKYYKGGNKK